MTEVTIKNSGATFTPTGLADFLADKLVSCFGKEVDRKVTVLDPACGKGELLSSISKKLKISGFKNFNIRGFDTNGQYLQDAELNLSEIKGISFDLILDDFLQSEGTILENPDLFNEISVKEYADIVIANPPYVRTQILGAEKAQKLAKRFKLKGRVDLYYPFLIGMTNVLKKGGLLGVITSNRYLFTKSGESIRKFLIENFDIIEVIDLGDTKLFDAAVLPAIFIGRKNSERKETTSALFAKIYEQTERNGNIILKKDETVFDLLKSNESGNYQIGDKKYSCRFGYLKHTGKSADIWQMTDDSENEWLEKVKLHTASKIGDFFKVRVGVKSCADNVFIKNDWANENFIPESVLFKKLISQENIKKWKGLQENDLKILYPYYSKDGKRFVYDLKDFPAAEKYFNANKEQLESRKYVIESGRLWYEIWVPQNPALWSLPKLVFPDISLESRFYYDDQGSVVNGNCYWISAKNEKENEMLLLIQGLANSKLMSKYHDLCFNNKLYSGRRRYFSQYIESYPLPNLEEKGVKEIVDLVKQLNNSSIKEDNLLDLENSLNYSVDKIFGV